MRNRELSDKVNEVIYSKAEAYKATTINKLKQSAENCEPNLRPSRENDLRFAQ